MSELVQLVIAYAKQEALEPVTKELKALVKGIAGAFLVAAGTVLLAIGFVRALQSELGSAGTAPRTSIVAYAPLTRAVHFGVTVSNPYANPYGVGRHLSGDWSWAPYMGGALFALLIAVFCATRIRSGAAK